MDFIQIIPYLGWKVANVRGNSPKTKWIGLDGEEEDKVRLRKSGGSDRLYGYYIPKIAKTHKFSGPHVHTTPYQSR